VKPPLARTDPLVAHLLDLLAPIGPVSARRMFGGVGLYLEGTMFGLVAGGELFFKVGSSNVADYESAGQGPFSYDNRNGTNTIGSYWSCPPELLDDPDAFRTWARKAAAAALAAAQAKPRSRRKRPVTRGEQSR
jgi:DNA transformation protein and related proteins